MGLAASRVDFAYRPGRPVLRGVSLEIAPGTLTVLIGPNGAGKSTLLRALLGVAGRLDGGDVLLEGRPREAISARERASRIGYIPQRSTLAFAYSVLQVVRMGRYAAGHGQGDGAALAALEQLGLSERADEPYGELSAGQQQR